MLFRNNADADQLEKIRYAYELSGYNLEFVALLEAESSAWDESLIHHKRYTLCWNWDAWNKGRLPNQEQCWKEYQTENETGVSTNNFLRNHDDRGLCGISDGYYKHIVDDPQFLDWKWQTEQCLILWEGGTTFYGKNNIHKTIKRFYFQ